MNRRAKAIDDVAFFHSDYAAVTAGHPNVSNKRRALVQQPLVRGLHMRVRAEDD
jgi:hypothetical protein